MEAKAKDTLKVAKNLPEYGTGWKFCSAYDRELKESSGRERKLRKTQEIWGVPSGMTKKLSREEGKERDLGHWLLTESRRRQDRMMVDHQHIRTNVKMLHGAVFDLINLLSDASTVAQILLDWLHSCFYQSTQMPNKTCPLAKVSASVETMGPFGEQLAWRTCFSLRELQMKELTLWVIVSKSIFNILPRSFVLRTSGVEWRAGWRRGRRHLKEEAFQPSVQAVDMCWRKCGQPCWLGTMTWTQTLLK